jgi:hypothetical protein
MASNIKHNLSRVKLIHNPNYQRSGIKSYVYLLRKYNFIPTLDGPYFVGNVVEQLGKPILASKFATHIGGKARVKVSTKIILSLCNKKLTRNSSMF